MPKNEAARRMMLAACTLGVVGVGHVAVAAPSKSTGTAVATPAATPSAKPVVTTVMNPFTLATVPAAAPVVVVPAAAAVVASPAPMPMSGVAPTKAGGMAATGIPAPPGPVIAPPLPPSAPVAP